MSQKVIFLMTECTCAFSTTKTRTEYPRRKNCQFVLVVSKVQGQKVIIKQANYFFFSVFLKGKMWMWGGTRSEWAVAAWGEVCLCSNSYLGEKLLKVPHKDLSLLLDELLAAELQVAVHILLRVNVVFLYLRRSLGTTETEVFRACKVWGGFNKK